MLLSVPDVLRRADAGVGSLHAQALNAPVPQNVAQLSASGSVEVVQDLLAITLSATREGSDATVVQTQLKTALDAALAEARKQAVPGQLDVRTGSFSLYPRYSREGKISNWVGSAELVLEGRDFSTDQRHGRPDSDDGGVADVIQPQPRTAGTGGGRGAGPGHQPVQGPGR
jgi:hypothetical protein